MASKRNIQITIDQDVWTHFKVIHFERYNYHLSSMINDYLRFVMSASEDVDQDVTDMQLELEELQQDQERINKRSASLMASLAMRKSNMDAARREELKKSVQVSNTIANSDLLKKL